MSVRDRVLGLLTAERLLALYPNEREGALSPRLAQLVNGQACARVARRIDLGPALRLTEAEAQLLKTLALSANAPVERHKLASTEADAAGRAVDVQVTRLRRKIEVDPRTPRYLQTVRGIGYMLAPD